jgi:hypothetical protein
MLLDDFARCLVLIGCLAVARDHWKQRAETAEAKSDTREALLKEAGEVLRFVHEHISDKDRELRDLYPAFGLHASRSRYMVSTLLDKLEGRSNG